MGDELDGELDFLVLKYVKRNKPTIDEFSEYIDEVYYGFDRESDYETKYRDKGMITAGNNDNFVLTSFGKIILKNISRKKNKEWIQTWSPTGALIITTLTLIFSIVIDF